jgi:hypothetical protein
MKHIPGTTDFDILRKTPIITGRKTVRSLKGVDTKVRATMFAVVAFPAWSSCLHHYTLIHLKLLYAFPDLCDGAYNLMTQNNTGRHGAFIEIGMQIAAANTAVLHVYNNFPEPCSGFRPLFELY